MKYLKCILAALRPVKYSIVTDGEKFALKRTSPLDGAKFLDLDNQRYWWGRTSGCFPCCWGTRERVEVEFHRRMV